MPESMRSFGVTSAPAVRTMSERERAVWAWPFSSAQVTPVARPFSISILRTRARSLTVRRGSDFSGSM